MPETPSHRAAVPPRVDAATTVILGAAEPDTTRPRRAAALPAEPKSPADTSTKQTGS